MNAIKKLICLLFIINIGYSSAADDSQKNLTARSIDSKSNLNDDQPFRINLSTSTSTNSLSVESKTNPSVKRRPVVANSKSETITNIQSPNKPPSPKIRKEKSDPYECPNTSEFSFFPKYCAKHSDCIASGKELRCCRQFNSKRCVKGAPKPIKEQRHEPILGLIPRKCPKEPLGELFWELKTCNTDHDCWPRICCPDGIKKYCRTSRPELEGLPAGRQLSYPIDALSGYLQCTPAPPTAYDLHPKSCNNTLDCFPNVCCQEAGKKYCRPPKRSLLAFVTTFAQRFNTGIIKQWTDNLVIRR